MRSYKTVMIVEDDALLAIIGEKLITKLGYKVVGKAVSGEEALLKIDECHPDILVMDIQLSGTLNGIETVEKLRERHNEIPVIFLSGNSESALKKKAKEVNCVDYLIKPINADGLIAPLRKAAKEVASPSYHAA
ncbi:MAG: response regulator [Balneolaceae bacterium]